MQFVNKPLAVDLSQVKTAEFCVPEYFKVDFASLSFKFHSYHRYIWMGNCFEEFAS